jgi:hypothetical protein
MLLPVIGNVSGYQGTGVTTEQTGLDSRQEKKFF